MNYFFILGHIPALSMAEIYSQIKANLIANIHELSDQVLILETKTEIDPNYWQKRLGGTIKIGKIFDQISARDLNKTINYQTILSLSPIRNKKINFGFSLYQLDKNSANIFPRLKQIALQIKKGLKEKDISSRWVSSKEKFLSSVILEKNKILEKGVEIVFLVKKNKIYLGKTESCQKFEEYSFRDWFRPAKKIDQGMIPVKLAKIMINLTGRRSGVLLDPFCGSGTILQEALLLGWNVIGTDINKEMILRTKENLKWLKNKLTTYNLQLTTRKIEIFQSDVKNISKKIAFQSIDAIVTEPYLGPVKLTTYNLQLIIKELSDLYLMAFKEFKKILRPDGKVIIVFPVFRFKNQEFYLEILEKLKLEGWRIKNPSVKINQRGGIIYSRPDQKVLREIFIFGK